MLSHQETWTAVNTALLAKAIAEFSYEELLDPEDLGGDRYRLRFDNGVRYEFRARRGTYGSWFVDDDSIRRFDAAGVKRATDALRFVLDSQQTLKITGETAGHLVKELASTLRADAALHDSRIGAAELADLSYAEVEGHQAGHPWIVPNKGRVGFSASDVERYAPESRQRIRLPWIGVDRSLAEFRGWAEVYEHELDETTRREFARVASPERFHWLPVHPWQWDHVVRPLFAAQLADGGIVHLGEAPDEHLPQQSIRTFSNVSRPDRHHVKLPLSILNTLVWRGLPTERTLAAPEVTAWIFDLYDRDPFLSEETRPVLLGEIASVTVSHEVLETIPGTPYQYRELLGAIWREPLQAKLDPGERARTLAALLYVDNDGRPLIAELVARSGLAARTWLRRLFDALIPPLLHFLYRYGVVFSPHGENAIVVFDGSDVPTRLAVKDFVDDVNVGEGVEGPDVLLQESPEFLPQFIHSALFVGHFRYLAELCRAHLGVDPEAFWADVRATVAAYQERFPDLEDRYRLYDLQTPRIERLCLNRNRLLLDGYADRPERPHAAVHGTVPNPLSGDRALSTPG